MGLQISKQVRCVTNIRAKGFSQGRRMLGTARFQSRSANTWCRTDRVQRTGEAVTVYHFILQPGGLFDQHDRAVNSDLSQGLEAVRRRRASFIEENILPIAVMEAALPGLVTSRAWSPRRAPPAATAAAKKRSTTGTPTSARDVAAAGTTCWDGDDSARRDGDDSEEQRRQRALAVACAGGRRPWQAPAAIAGASGPRRSR